ncbi:hypothetical protein KRR40_27245 [Niabella defluvii]|nr:hypothetical protein KRR40_27245 [Niabella sp. I65]
MKKLLFSAALTMGFAAVSFAGSPKGNTKEATPTKAEATSQTQTLHWYQVTYNATYPNGAILNAGDYEDTGEKSEIVSPCEPGNNQDCLRGFAEELQTFPETTLPSSANERIQKQ